MRGREGYTCVVSALRPSLSRDAASSPLSPCVAARGGRYRLGLLPQSHIPISSPPFPSLPFFPLRFLSDFQPPTPLPQSHRLLPSSPPTRGPGPHPTTSRLPFPCPCPWPPPPESCRRRPSPFPSQRRVPAARVPGNCACACASRLLARLVPCRVRNSFSSFVSLL